MKHHKLPYLFFCFVLLNIPGVFNNSLHAQNTPDSTSIYYHAILQINDINLTGKAFEFFNKKAEQSLMQGDTIKAAYHFELIALGQFKMGFTHESELTAVKAMGLLDAIKDRTKTAEPRKRLTNHLGMVYRKIEDYDNAIWYYNLALELKDNLVDKIAILTNMANTHADSDNYQEAAAVLIPHYDSVLAMKETETKAVYLDNLGYFQSKTGHSSALNNMELALQIRLSLEDMVALFSSYRHLFLFYLDQNDKAKAITYFNKMKALSDQINSPIFELETMELKMKLEGNSDFMSYVALKNETERKKQLQENNYAAIKYDFQKKEKEAQKLELQIKDSQIEAEQEKLNKTIYQSITILGLFLTVFLYVIVRTKHRKDKLQQVYNTETRISKKVHDEVANDLYRVMTKIQKTETIKEAILDDLEEVYNKTRDISKESSIIDIHGTYEAHLRDLLQSYKSDAVNIITKDLSKVNWEGLDHDKKITLHRVLQELMTNMRKHSKATLVVLTFSQKGKKIIIDYKDNGIGTNLIKNSGLHNTENRMESINGTITFETKVNNGFKARVSL
ncbi:hypothetical protein V8G56_12415 [Gaetbulibacter aquiaggeris]|uniref:Tetratricopeptide repeat protein n=1 Tax=Gaetbulibacter aquiaggeris TaxID=1735373 RepID=A0ABW7MRS8_9FLAO